MISFFNSLREWGLFFFTYFEFCYESGSLTDSPLNKYVHKMQNHVFKFDLRGSATRGTSAYTRLSKYMWNPLIVLHVTWCFRPVVVFITSARLWFIWGEGADNTKLSAGRTRWKWCMYCWAAEGKNYVVCIFKKDLYCSKQGKGQLYSKSRFVL